MPLELNFIEVGLLVLVIAGVAFGAWLLRRISRPALEMFERGRDIGYAAGVKAEREENEWDRRLRPVVVPLRCPHCGESTIHKAS